VVELIVKALVLDAAIAANNANLLVVMVIGY
jgi:hypothetical protein